MDEIKVLFFINRFCYCFVNSKSSYQIVPIIGQASPQKERAVLIKIPSASSGAVKSMLICCQSFVPIGNGFEDAIGALVFILTTSKVGGPALFRSSVFNQKLRRYFFPDSVTTACVISGKLRNYKVIEGHAQTSFARMTARRINFKP